MSDEVREMTAEQAALVEAVNEYKSSECLDCGERFTSLNEAEAHRRDFDHETALHLYDKRASD